MKPQSVVFAAVGAIFGLIAGWIIGSQQAQPGAPRPAPAPSAAAAPSGGESSSVTRAAALDEAQVQALKRVAEQEPSNATPRIQLGNLYLDAERYPEAIQWYGEAVKLAPNDVDASTDLGVCLYYTNQPDQALAQFAHSLQIDPKHTKTLLNVGIVKAFGKQDLAGAIQAWQQVIDVSPESPEGQAAKRALDGIRSAHPGAGGASSKPGT